MSQIDLSIIQTLHDKIEKIKQDINVIIDNINKKEKEKEKIEKNIEELIGKKDTILIEVNDLNQRKLKLETTLSEVNNHYKTLWSSITILNIVDRIVINIFKYKT